MIKDKEENPEEESETLKSPEEKVEEPKEKMTLIRLIKGISKVPFE